MTMYSETSSSSATKSPVRAPFPATILTHRSSRSGTRFSFSIDATAAAELLFEGVDRLAVIHAVALRAARPILLPSGQPEITCSALPLTTDSILLLVMCEWPHGRELAL